MQERRKAREFVLKATYAYEIVADNIDQIFDTLLVDHGLHKGLVEFSRELTHLTVAHRQEFDDIIAQKSRNWDFERIALIDRLLLRMAMAEFFYFPDIPPKVSISEAIEIAKVYSTDDSGSFINGILDAVLNDGLAAGRITAV